MLLIDGFTLDDKVPGAVAMFEFTAGRISIGAIPLICVLMGTMDESAGSKVPDSDFDRVFSDEEAAAYYGPRSELANMCYAALEIPGVSIWAAAVDAPGGAANAAATSVVGGTWTTAGEVILQFDQQIIRIGVAADDTIDGWGANAAAAINQADNGRLFCSATYTAGTDTLTYTVNSAGVRGNQHTVFLDLSNAPTGFTLTLVGGTALDNGGIPFTGGSGTDDVEPVLDTVVNAIQCDYLAAAQNDATNVAAIEAKANAKAAFDVALLEQYHISTNGNLASAVSIAQTTMNDVLGSMHWVQFGVEHPSRIAARIAAKRSITEGADPNHNYDEEVLTGAAPHFRPGDSPERSTLKAALNAGITPYRTVNGELQIVRAICSHSLTGTTPDYRTLDLGDVSVPIRIRKELVVLFAALKVENPHAGPDLTDDATTPPPEGTFTPNLWSSSVYNELKNWEGPQFNWITDVDNHRPESEWDPDAKRVMSLVPLIVKSQNHQVGIIIRQQAA